jgi:hypothetical protein
MVETLHPHVLQNSLSRRCAELRLDTICESHAFNPADIQTETLPRIPGKEMSAKTESKDLRTSI